MYITAIINAIKPSIAFYWPIMEKVSSYQASPAAKEPQQELNIGIWSPCQ